MFSSARLNSSLVLCWCNVLISTTSALSVCLSVCRVDMDFFVWNTPFDWLNGWTVICIFSHHFSRGGRVHCINPFLSFFFSFSLVCIVLFSCMHGHTACYWMNKWMMNYISVYEDECGHYFYPVCCRTSSPTIIDIIRQPCLGRDSV